MNAKTRQNKTLGSRLLWAIYWPVALVSACGIVALQSPGATLVSQQPAEMSDRPSRVEQLVESHHCWTGAGPEGVEPTKAVVTLPGQKAQVRSADLGFKIWLEGKPGVVHAFCR